MKLIKFYSKRNETQRKARIAGAASIPLVCLLFYSYIKHLPHEFNPLAWVLPGLLLAAGASDPGARLAINFF